MVRVSANHKKLILVQMISSEPLNLLTSFVTKLCMVVHINQSVMQRN